MHKTKPDTPRIQEEKQPKEAWAKRIKKRNIRIAPEDLDRVKEIYQVRVQVQQQNKQENCCVCTIL